MVESKQDEITVQGIEPRYASFFVLERIALFCHLFDVICCTAMFLQAVCLLCIALCSALEALINFAYNGRIQIDTTNVQLLLVGSSFLHLQVVKDACCDFMKHRYVIAINIAGLPVILHDKPMQHLRVCV